jgi:hypothetical protein
LIGCLVAAVFSGGCCLPEIIEATWQPYETLKLRERIKRRAHRQAKQDWEQQFAGRSGQDACAEDMRQGFITAYEEAALGMRNCPPPIPERRLVSRHTLAHTYPAAVPWYQGYNLGRAMAEARGVDRWRFAPVNPDLALAACHAPRPVHSLEPPMHAPAPGTPAPGTPAPGEPATGEPASGEVTPGETVPVPEAEPEAISPRMIEPENAPLPESPASRADGQSSPQAGKRPLPSPAPSYVEEGPVPEAGVSLKDADRVPEEKWNNWLGPPSSSDL